MSDPTGSGNDQDPEPLRQHSITVKHQAFDKSVGMTLTELETFVGEAYQRGINPLSSVKISVGWKRQIQTIEVSGQAQPYDPSRAREHRPHN